MTHATTPAAPRDADETRTTLPKPTIHDPASYWRAYHLGGEGRTRAEQYVCYLREGAPSNSYSSKIGIGSTERESLLDATYWSNQAPWAEVVPLSKAPAWVLRQLQECAD